LTEGAVGYGIHKKFILKMFIVGVLSTGQKIRQDKQDEQDYFIFHHGKS
jgi:hypothetical protein